MATARRNRNVLGEGEETPEKGAGIPTPAAKEASGAVRSHTEGVNSAALRAAQVGNSKDFQGEPDQSELSPERQFTLTLLLERYDENLDKGLYTAANAPKAEVEK